jgi:hypothetical protein
MSNFCKFHFKEPVAFKVFYSKLFQLLSRGLHHNHIILKSFFIQVFRVGLNQVQYAGLDDISVN